MVKKLALLVPLLVLSLLIGVASFSPLSSAQSELSLQPQVNGVIDKTPSETFSVTIGFGNSGTNTGTWSIVPVFEGNDWTWKGTAQTVTLNSGESQSLTWNGTVPSNAPIDSIARLVLYYGNSFAALDWWIHVKSGAQLSVTSSDVD
jgi:hypothetical protein